MSMHFLTFVFNFITYWPLLWKNYLQIIKLLVFPSRTFRKQLASCCSKLPGPKICIPNLLICISLLNSHSDKEITFKLSDNQDFLQEPAGSSWQTVAACFHAHRSAFLSFWKFVSLISHFCGEITFKLSGNRYFLQVPSRSSWQAISGGQKDFALIFHFWDLKLC